MNSISIAMLKLWQGSTLLPLAQISDPTDIETPEAASILFSGPQFFIALISGVLLAFAIQLLLTNFSVATGISILGGLSKSDDRESDDSSGSLGSTIRKIGFGVGIWTLISVSVALFFACYLAVQLSLLTTPRLGIIISLVIWAAYFSLLVWVSSTTVGSLIGSVVQTATSGFQAVVGTATAALGGQAAKQQVISTAEAVVETVKNELGAGIDPASIRSSIEGYVNQLRLPSLDMASVQGDLENLLNDPEIAALADKGELRNIDRQTFLDLVSQRTDLSRQEVNRLADLLEGVWRKTLGQRRTDSTTELIEYLRSTQPGQLKLEDLNAKVDRLISERQSSQNQSNTGVIQTAQSGLNTMLGLLVGRSDLADLNLGQVLQRLQSTSTQVADQAQKLVGREEHTAYNPIVIDAENYLLNTYSWQMDRETINQEFRDVLYDPQADPAAVIAGVEQLNRDQFAEWLTSRGVFTQDEIQALSDQLEAIRREVLLTAQADLEQETRADLQRRISIYLSLTPTEQLISSDILPGFKALIEDEQADFETLTQRFDALLSRSQLEQTLQQRQGLTIVEQSLILDGLERTRDQVLAASRSLNEQAQQRYGAFQQRLQDYLRNTGKAELNPEGIQRDLKLMMHDPETGISAFKRRAAQFDRDTFVQLLSQREDMSEADANRIVNQVESSWYRTINAPSAAVQVVKEQYDETLSSISDYLRRTNLEELDPDGIQRDLKQLLDDPKAGTIALRQRLSKVDRETLVRLLSQRPDLTEAQVNRNIDQVLAAIGQIARTPRRLALRTQQQVADFESSLEDYLRRTDKEELNPEGIKRDLQLLVNSPKLGAQNLGDRLSRMDRSTLVALLAQRSDMTQAEAEQVVANIESVRDQFLAQLQQIQARIQSVVDRILMQVRNYLNSLDRPELNYEGIRNDFQTLFDDPQAGFEALRMRLGQFDRGTAVALLSSREDISEADANRVIDQIESARTNVLQRAERIQTEAQRRLEAVKHQAQRQLEETRKAAAIAAWWLFATALVSAIAAAVGGALASS